MTGKLFPTSLVGSYPQPEWLIDRARLSKMVPRVRMDDLWLADPKQLEALKKQAEAAGLGGGLPKGLPGGLPGLGGGGLPGLGGGKLPGLGGLPGLPGGFSGLPPKKK